MAGPSIMVRVLADLTGMATGFDQAATKGSAAASKMHGAFSGVLGQLNSAGVLGPFGGALATADASLSRIGDHGADAGAKLMGVGGAVAGVGLALSAMGSKDQAAHQQLQAAVKATGHEYDQYATKIEAAVKHQEAFGNTANQTQDALRVLTQATKDPAKALELLGTASDLAAAKHEDLTTAATQMGKAYNGNTRILKEFGIASTAAANPAKDLEKATKDATKADDDLAKAKQHLIEVQTADADKKKLTASEALKLKEAQDKVTGATMTAAKAHADLTTAQHNAAGASNAHGKALDELSKKLSGQAGAAAQTFGGHLKAIKAAVEDNVATLGQKYGPALTAAGAAMTGLGAVMEIAKAAQIGDKIETLAGAAANGVATAAQWALNAAMDANPLVLIVSLIALVVGAVIAIGIKFGWWKAITTDLWHWIDTAFHFILSIVQDVWHWIADHWPLLLAILGGPFTTAAYFIITNWQNVVNFFKQVPGWISGVFSGALNWLENAGRDVIQGLLNGLTKAWHTVTDFLGNAASKVGNFLKNPLSIFSPSQVMHEQGVFIMEGLGLGLQAGFDRHVATALNRTVAALTPGGATSATSTAGATAAATASTSRGPAVVVHQATFNNGVDLDVFMGKAAWAVRTQRM